MKVVFLGPKSLGALKAETYQFVFEQLALHALKLGSLTLYSWVFDVVYGRNAWLDSRMANRNGPQWREIEDYVTNETPFPPRREGSVQVWAYLYFFVELAHHFGWDVFKRVFRMYRPVNSEGETPESDEGKEDLFYINFSRQVNDCILYSISFNYLQTAPRGSCIKFFPLFKRKHIALLFWRGIFQVAEVLTDVET